MSDPGHSEPLDRRRFLVVAGVAIGGVAAAGATWLLRADPLETGASPASTSGVPATTSAPTTATAPTTAVPSTTIPPEITTTNTAITTTAAPVADVVDVICKEAWGARPAAGEFTSHTIEHITVRHTAAVLSSNSAAPGRARQHQSYHQGLGWPDLAYHYLIDANGHVYEGRPVDAVGDTATDYDPTAHFLVCCEGDFNTQEIAPAQYESLVTMLAWGAAEFGVDVNAIQGHRDVASTTCPGDNLYPLVADGTIASDVASQLAAGVPQLEIVCGPTAIDLVAAIEAGTV